MPNQNRSDVTKILFFIGSLDIGGAEMQLYHLMHHLDRKKYKGHLFVLQSDGPMQQNYASSGIPVFSAGLKKGDLRKNPWKIIPAFFRLIRCIQNVRPLVIHSFLPLVTCLGSIAGRVCHVPFIVTSKRALGTHQDRFPVLRLLDKAANHLSHRITANSKAVLRDAVRRERLAREKATVIYNGIPIDAVSIEMEEQKRSAVRGELGLHADATVVICVANLILYKGHSDMLQSARMLVEKGIECTFLLVGEDRGCQKQLETEIKNLELSDHVVFLGQRNDVADLLTASDLSVLTSHEEGFSNVLLESMAAGLPVVATRVGGNPEIVDDGVTGWLVPPRKPEAIADKMADLIRNPEKAKSWGMSGRSRVRSLFSLDKMINNHKLLYEQAIGKPDVQSSGNTDTN